MRHELEITVNFFTSTAGSSAKDTSPFEAAEGNEEDEEDYLEDRLETEGEEQEADEDEKKIENEDVLEAIEVNSSKDSSRKLDIAVENESESPLKGSEDVLEDVPPVTVVGFEDLESAILEEGKSDFEGTDEKDTKPLNMQGTSASIESLAEGSVAETLYAESFYSDTSNNIDLKASSNSIEDNGYEEDNYELIEDVVIQSSRDEQTTAKENRSDDVPKRDEGDGYEEVDFYGEEDFASTAGQQDDLLPPQNIEEFLDKNDSDEAVKVNISPPSASERDVEEKEIEAALFDSEVYNEEFQEEGEPFVAPDPPKHSNQLESDENEVVSNEWPRAGDRDDYGEEDFDD